MQAAPSWAMPTIEGACWHISAEIGNHLWISDPDLLDPHLPGLAWAQNRLLDRLSRMAMATTPRYFIFNATPVELWFSSLANFSFL